MDDPKSFGLTYKKITAIEIVEEQGKDSPDGAYLQMMEDAGISVEDLEKHTRWLAEKRKRIK